MRRFLGPRGAAVVVVVAIVVLIAGVLIRDSGGSGSTASAATPAQQIGMRILLITDSSDPTTANGIAYGDWVNTLKREGVPYDTVVTNTASPGQRGAARRCRARWPTATESANYEGVVLAAPRARWASAAPSGRPFRRSSNTSHVRQVTAYAVPSGDYGLTYLNRTFAASGATDPLPHADPDVGRRRRVPVFELGRARPGQLRLRGHPRAPATPRSCPVRTAARCWASTRRRTAGRRCIRRSTRTSTCSRASCCATANWTGSPRNTYFGDQRNYLETHIDDNFLSDAAWSVAGNATTAAHSTDFNAADALREVPADVTHSGHVVKAEQLPHRHAVQRRRQRRRRGRRQPRRRGRLRQRDDRQHRDHRLDGSSTSTTPCPIRCSPAFQANDPTTGQALHRRLRLDQPHLGPPQHRRGLRDPELHRGRAQPEHQLGRARRPQRVTRSPAAWG